MEPLPEAGLKLEVHLKMPDVTSDLLEEFLCELVKISSGKTI